MNRHVCLIALAIWLALLCGCGNQELAPGPENQRAPDPSPSSSTTLQGNDGEARLAAELARLDELPGAPGAAWLVMGSQLYAGLHGTYPTSIEAISALLPVPGLLDAYTGLEVSQHPDGREILLARSATTPEIAALAAAQAHATSGKWDGFDPGPGIEGQISRGFVLAMGDADGLLTAPLESGLFTQFVGHLKNPFSAASEEESGVRNRPPALTPQNARLGLLAAVLQSQLLADAMRSDSHRPPASLAAFAELHGGLNPDGWINPYSGQPMQNVPLSSPQLGDYTELSHPDGVQIAIHYPDAEGGLSTRIVGERGEFAPLTLDGRNIGTSE